MLRIHNNLFPVIYDYKQMSYSKGLQQKLYVISHEFYAVYLRTKGHRSSIWIVFVLRNVKRIMGEPLYNPTISLQIHYVCERKAQLEKILFMGPT